MPRGLENTEVESQKEEVKPVEKTEEITKTSAHEVHWKVPSDTTKVYLYEFDESGKQITSYTISNYITMTPNHTFVIVAKT